MGGVAEGVVVPVVVEGVVEGFVVDVGGVAPMLGRPNLLL